MKGALKTSELHRQWSGALVEIRLLALFVIFLVGMSGCEDLLPAYEEPKDIFRVHLALPYNDVIKYFGMDSNDPSRARYDVVPPNLEIDVGIENLYDDALEGEIYITGKLEMEYEKFPEMKMSIPLGPVNAGSSPMLDYTTNTMRILPNQTLWLRAFWDYKFNGQWVFAFAPFDYYFENRRYYVLHKPMKYRGRATVQLFSTRRGPVRSEMTEFEFTFQGAISFPP